MNTWFYKIEDLDEPIKRINDANIADVSFNTIKSNFTSCITSFKDNTVVQWITTPFLKPSEGMFFQISIESQDVFKFIIENVAGFFETVKTIHENNILKNIRLSDFKEELREILMLNYTMDKNSINPIIRDFYLDKNFSVTPFSQIEAVHYEVSIESFQRLTPSKTLADETLWNFFLNTSIERYGNIILSPEGWSINDDLINSSFLAYICRYAKRVILTVNQLNHHIRAIEIR